MGPTLRSKTNVEPGMTTTLDQAFGCLDVQICIYQVWEGFLPCTLVLAKVLETAPFMCFLGDLHCARPGLQEGDFIVIPQNWVQCTLSRDGRRGNHNLVRLSTHVATPEEAGYSPDWNEPLVVQVVALWNLVARQGNFCAVLTSPRFHPRFYGGSSGDLDSGHTIPPGQSEGWREIIQDAREDVKRIHDVDVARKATT